MFRRVIGIVLVLVSGFLFIDTLVVGIEKLGVSLCPMELDAPPVRYPPAGM